MVANETYRRGQVEWAIWRFFTLMRSAPPDPPKVFLTRIKRLLETDRHDRVPDSQDFGPAASFAFSSTKSEGQGTDAVFSAFDAFCLALALDLTDVGFKPSEIVFLLRHLRPSLLVEFEAVARDPPSPVRRPEPATHRPDLPSYQLKGRDLADGRVFWVVQKVELKEIYIPGPAKQKKSQSPIFLEPKFCRGIQALSTELNQMNTEKWGYRKALVLEIAYLATELSRLLSKAPPIKRGRT